MAIVMEVLMSKQQHGKKVL